MDRARALLLCAAAATLLAGCLGPATTRPAQLFVLDATAEPGTRTSDLRLAVGRITLPERLNRPQIVTRTGANEVYADDHSQWAESLEKSIPRVLSQNLAQLSGTERVFVTPWPSPIESDLRVEVAILEFEGNRDAAVSLVARWRWVRADGSEAHPLQLSSYVEPISNRSTEALVAAMSRALGTLSRDIAAAISPP